MIAKSKIITPIQQQDFLCVVDDDFNPGTMTIIDEITGQPLDITGWQLFMDIYQAWADKNTEPPTDPLISLSIDEGFTIINATLGQFDFTILSAQTGAIPIPSTQPYGQDVPQNSCVYDFVAVDQNNLQRTRMRGNFIFQQRLTTVT